jgi:helix-turn-helix, Psq domain/Tc5 transposase DNA-binding domain
MPEQSKEARILIAIEALRIDPKLSVRKAATIYDVPETTLHNRMNGAAFKAETWSQKRLLNELEEKVLLKHIMDLDNRGFSPKLGGVEDMANYILASQKKQPVGKLWAHRFVQRNPELKTRFSRSYNFQRALCEDPKLIENWFQRLVDIKAKFGVQDCDIWNFDKTGFMMGVISSSMVVTQADRKGRHKRV